MSSWCFPEGPWLRTGPGNALDGKLKWDLNQFNQGYCDRLRARESGHAALFRHVFREFFGVDPVVVQGRTRVIEHGLEFRAARRKETAGPGADVAVAAGPVGRDASAATDSRAKASIYSYSMSKGLFAGMSFEGSVLNQNRDANRAYWGRDLSAAAALKRPANDKRIKPLVDSLNILVKKAP